MELELHDYQYSILKTLLFNPGSRFSELNKVDVTSDHFNFHVKKLIESGLILKKGGKYFLTAEGKEFAGRMDTDKLRLEKQAKTCVALHAVRETNGEVQYLIHHRLKEPFYGWYGSHSGKIHWGETPEEAAAREFFEESGLTGDFTLKGIVHHRDYDRDGRLLDDKFMWVFRVENTKGDLKTKVEEGENIWMSESEIRKTDRLFASYDEMVEVIDGKNLVFINRDRTVDSY
jgi:8-oxo-dGTP pyrophosphatase MutT (NUDIX family)